MQKSVLVAVDRLVKHKKYDRVLKRTTKLMVRPAGWRGRGGGRPTAASHRSLLELLPLLSSAFRCWRLLLLPAGCCCRRRCRGHQCAGSRLAADRRLTPPSPCRPRQAHDEGNECNVGDTVRVHISRPLSKRKSWVVTQVLHRARVFDAESAAQAAAADAAAHQHGGSSSGGSGGLGAPSFAASAVTGA